MKNFWKKLNEPCITTIGLLGWLGWFMINLEKGWLAIIGIFLMMFAIINYIIREVYKNKQND